MRPASIVNFERTFLASVVVGLVNSLLSWDQTVALVQAQPGVQLGSTFVVTILVAGLAINLVLWYFIARQASVVAKWILTVLFAIGAIGVVMNLVTGSMLSGINTALGILALLLQAFAVWMLFRPDAVGWLAGGGRQPGSDAFS